MSATMALRRVPPSCIRPFIPSAVYDASIRYFATSTSWFASAETQGPIGIRGHEGGGPSSPR